MARQQQKKKRRRKLSVTPRASGPQDPCPLCDEAKEVLEAYKNRFYKNQSFQEQGKKAFPFHSFPPAHGFTLPCSLPVPIISADPCVQQYRGLSLQLRYSEIPKEGFYSACYLLAATQVVSAGWDYRRSHPWITCLSLIRSARGAKCQRWVTVPEGKFAHHPQKDQPSFHGLNSVFSFPSHSTNFFILLKERNCLH
ncbi:glutaredoxin-like protein C5orf63 homolog isoform X2 [Herpailurus yagouaroundi]|uniref:glutaredoxin-like protein C5orf63 homolog isoform X2 n=1 Tax=Herpailurus yagouaroundi TaxID=1608482 RepID=UPI001AD7D4E8|nr:glutaredoxin-like protein C5orf63 homolog isoform X2 [Puma yagouaroundi]